MRSGAVENVGWRLGSRGKRAGEKHGHDDARRPALHLAQRFELALAGVGKRTGQGIKDEIARRALPPGVVQDLRFGAQQEYRFGASGMRGDECADVRRCRV